MADQSTVTKTTAEEAHPAEPMRSGYYFRPNVDILEQADELLVLADVPGASPSGIDVNFEDGMLTIHAKVPPRHEETQFLVREYGVGDYYRTFRVHETIDAGKITADFGDGVLTLRCPRPKRPNREKSVSKHELARYKINKGDVVWP